MEGKCNNCGEIKTVVKHHVSYFPELIIQLCKSCHRAEHCRTHNFLKDDKKLFYRKPVEGMRSIQVSDDAWVVLKSKQVELMKVTGKVQTIGTVASDIIVKSKEGELK